MPDNRYSQILERIFFAHYRPGDVAVEFERKEIKQAARELGIAVPENLGDLVYSFRFRTELPERVRKTAPDGLSWVIKLAGSARYRFEMSRQWSLTPNPALLRVKVPDATPGIITRYALGDEQALLALVRYNRLVDVFTGVACYSLQNHLRTTVKGTGQIEVDELYVGVDRRGAHFVFPVQAKGGRDRISNVQLEQDFALCAEKFPQLICRPLAAQFLADGGVALMEFASTADGLRLVMEKHYVLVTPDELTDADLALYRSTGESS